MPSSATRQGLGSIINDDAVPTLSINDVNVLEGNSVNFVVTLSSASTQVVTVKYATANGSAIAPGDYTAKTGTVTIAAGQTRGIINIVTIGETLDELDESFFVNLSAATNATIADTQGRGIIIDNDSPPAVTINDATVTEGDTGTTNATFTVSLSTASGQTISINATPFNGTARSPFDYVTGGARLIFAPGETVKTVIVPVKGDLLDELDETFFVILDQAVNCSVGRARATGTILNDDAASPPVISIDSPLVKEGNVGLRNATFHINLSKPSGKVVSVTFTTSNRTVGTGVFPATANVDYQPLTTTVKVSAGQTIAIAHVVIIGDTLDEANETFQAKISNPVNGAIATGKDTGICTILDDDSAPSLTINDVSTTEGNSGTKNLNFTVTLSKASGQTVTVKYATADGVARSTSDYTAKTGTLTFAAGQTSKTISVAIKGDTIVEGNETLFVLLSGATAASIGRARGVGTIVNNDSSQ